jgi:hypothetical protein
MTSVVLIAFDALTMMERRLGKEALPPKRFLDCDSQLSENLHARQGCQMVSFFRPKIPVWAYYGGTCNGKYRYMLWPFGIFYDYWVFLCAFGNFAVISPLWYIVPRKIWQP